MLLRLKSEGEAVRAVQEMLNFLGFRDKRMRGRMTVFLSLKEDGKFGVHTENTVIDFQRSEGLLADGVVGPNTMRALQSAYAQRRLELDAPPADSLRGGVPNRFTFERVPADAYDKGYSRLSLRNDAAGEYRALYAAVHRSGGILTSSGGLRGLDATVTRSRSATSFHYLGRALDLYLYSGMADPDRDPYVIERVEPRKYVVWARCSTAGAPDAELAKATQAGNPAGGTATAVAAEVVAFTHIDLDKDLTQFVKSDLTAAQTTLLESHRDMVRASLEARRAFLRMVAELV